MKAMWHAEFDHKVADCFSHYPVGILDKEDELGEMELTFCLAVSQVAARADANTGEEIIDDSRISQVKMAG